MSEQFIKLPTLDPVMLKLGPVSLHWYGMMYLFGFIFAYWLGTRRAKKSDGVWSVEQVDQLLFNCFGGIILGGRIGDVFFYSFDRFLADPLYLFRIWEGGMSFHGGLLGVIVAMMWTSYRQKRRFWQTSDFFAPLIPFGLGAGRLGNFINGELWGRVTDVPWAMIFPTEPSGLPRHPSQLYELFLEGMVLFIILNWFIRKPRPTGSVSALFLIGYGIFRFLVEYVREPDANVTAATDLLTRGQWLCVPMIIGGTMIMAWAYKRQDVATQSAVEKG